MVRTSYISKLKWLRQKYIVLWDEEDKRGWLVNGTSALLHLVRASLEHDRTRELNYNMNDMEEASITHTANSPIPVLISLGDKKLKIRLGATDNICLMDRVEQILNMLEMSIDHQYEVTRRGALNLKLTPQKYLEGWDFMDLATDEDPIYPRVATLQAINVGWIDFTRAIGAITLFGRGFGEIIQPACARRPKLRKGRYYLAVSDSDVKEINDRFG